MKKIYVVAGLIAVLFFLENPDIAATEQDIISLSANMESGMIENSDSDSIPPPLFRSLDWIFIVPAAISALSLLLFMFFKQKQKRRTQHVFTDSIQNAEPPNPHPHPRPQAKLVYMGETDTNDSHSSRIFFLDQRKITIGRADENTIIIPGSTVSTFHATILFQNGQFQLIDHHSLNGTFLRNSRIPPNKPVVLKHGDNIKFATFAFHFLRTDKPPSDATILMANILKVDS